MKFVPASAVIAHHRRIDAKVADAVAALRAADDKLGQAVDDFDDTNARAALREADERMGIDAEECAAFSFEACFLGKTELMEARYTARFFADMLDQGATPTIRARVFDSIASYDNVHPDNVPHVEGAILALKLAERSLASALELAEQPNGDDVDEPYQQAFAARGVVRGSIVFLTSGAFVFNVDQTLDGIVAAKRTLALCVA